MGLKKTTKVGIALAALLVAMSATAVASAQSSNDSTTLSAVPTGSIDLLTVKAPGTVAADGVVKTGVVTRTSVFAADRLPLDGCPEFLDGDIVIDEFFGEDLPQEIIDEINAEGAELAAAFDAAGISYELVTDEMGVTYPEWDWDDDAANDVADEFFGELFGDDEFFGEDLPQEIIDEINAEGAELAAAFDAAGVSYELVTDEMGVTYPEWDWDDDAANDVADEFFGELFGDDEFFGEDLPQEIIDEINAEGAELAAAFDAAGISYELVTDEMGVTYPEWDWDDEAAGAIVDAFYTDAYGEFEDEFVDCFGDELPHDIIIEINAEGAELAAAFDAAGVSYELVTDEMGVTYPEWDWDDDAAEAVVDEFYGDKFGEFEDDIFFDGELPQEIIDEINAEGAELAAAFDAAGVSYELVTDEIGITYPEWDWKDDAANEIAEQYFDQLDGFVVDTGVLDLGAFDDLAGKVLAGVSVTKLGK